MAKWLLGIAISHIGVPSSSPGWFLQFQSSSLPMSPWETAVDGLSAWVPTTPTEGPEGIPDPWLGQRCWGRLEKKLADRRSLFLSLCLSFKLKRKKGRKEGREGWREAGREKGREERREGRRDKTTSHHTEIQETRSLRKETLISGEDVYAFLWFRD